MQSASNDIRSLREARDLTGPRLVAMSDLALVTLQAAETRQRTPSPETHAELAAALDVSVEELGAPLLTAADWGRLGRRKQLATAPGPLDPTEG